MEKFKFWEKEIHNLVIFHGSSAMFLESIEKYGLDPAIKLFDASQLYFLEGILSWKNGFKWGYSTEIYVSFYREVSLNNYAKEGPAIIFDTLPRAQQLYKEWQGRNGVSEKNRQKLLLFICREYLSSMRRGRKTNDTWRRGIPEHAQKPPVTRSGKKLTLHATSL